MQLPHSRPKSITHVGCSRKSGDTLQIDWGVVTAAVCHDDVIIASSPDSACCLGCESVIHHSDWIDKQYILQQL